MFLLDIVWKLRQAASANERLCVDIETNMILDFAIVVSQSQSLDRLDQSTACVFSSSEFFPSFLIVETSFILHLLLSLKCELLHLNFVELFFFLQKRHIPFGTRRATA